VLARQASLRCNTSLFNFKGARRTMKAPQRRHYSFDTRSVMLFAALSLGGAGALQAQTAPPSSPPQFGPQGKGSAQAGSGFSVGPNSSSGSGGTSAAAAAAAAFDRADTNKDGQLSPQEAAALPAISQRFKELDTDQNGSLSRAEFDKGVQS
jgi:hypothetical protein